MFKTKAHRGSFIFCLLTQLGVMYRRHLTDKEGERELKSRCEESQ